MEKIPLKEAKADSSQERKSGTALCRDIKTVTTD